MEGSRLLVFASSVLVFLPCPFSDFSSYLPSFGGRGICGTVSELRDGVEHKFSDLPRDEACLVLGSYFLRFLSAGRCWMEEDHSHFCSVHRPSSVSARVCCCYRAGLLGRGPLGGSGMSTLAQPRWASFIWGHVLLPSWELWHVSHLVSRGVKWQTCHSPKDVATRLSNWEAMSSS